MIDEYSLRMDGWARFSKDGLHRFRLARMLVPTFKLAIVDGKVMGLAEDDSLVDLVRIVFLMVNPSTANAFKPDPTVSKCVKFAQRWGAQALEVVNLFTFRSQFPKDLDSALDRGEGPENDAAILAACRGATRVVAAWGNNGTRGGRDETVRAMLAREGIQLSHLGLTDGGHPQHPLSRGKKFIPIEREPVIWERAA